jgi:CHAT domain-containing protein/predicted negative regulator of RcsB-dependent stress response
MPYTEALLLAKKLRNSGRLAEAATSFQRAAQLAIAAKDVRGESAAWLGVSGCDIRLYRYQEALETGDHAYRLAVSANDDTLAGGAAGDKAAVYYELGDFRSASSAADDAVARLEHSPRKEFLARALLISGDSKAKLGRSSGAIADLKQAVIVSRDANLAAVEGEAQDHLGEKLLQVGDPGGADMAFQSARKLRVQVGSADDVLITDAHIAELKYAEKRYPEALGLIDHVLTSGSASLSGVPRYWPLQLKGEVLLAMGQADAALAAFGEAVASADRWRRDILPGDNTVTSTVVSLSTVYLNFVDTAASLSLARHDRVLARRALEVLIADRAWSLREQMVSELKRDLLLPPRYYELLSSLQEMQAQVTLGRDRNAQQGDNARLGQIRLELSGLENRIGIQSQSFSTSGEKDSLKTSLTSIQSHLTRDELLLSFSLGEPQSYLWTVTRDQINLHELPPAKEIAERAHMFANSVEHGQQDEQRGQELSRTLFGEIAPGLLARREWLVAPDGALLDQFPFSALPDPAKGSTEPLTARRTLRLLVSEALLTAGQGRIPTQSFVGVADPIYNLADSRRAPGVALVAVRHQASMLSLGRLTGSDREVRASAAAAGLPGVQILTGANASISGVKAAFSERPEIVHFAVHVVSPESAQGEAKGEAALALSLTGNQLPELLTKETVAAMRVPGSLVVLSGCASEQGEILPSAGLVGLSRAWLLAGAAAVLVTAWPTPDDSGTFFQSFYSHFRIASGTISERAALSLQQAQSDMRASSGYRNKAAFWSAYSLISKE